MKGVSVHKIAHINKGEWYGYKEGVEAVEGAAVAGHEGAGVFEAGHAL